MNPLQKLYDAMVAWGYVEDGKTYADFQNAMAAPEKRKELYGFLQSQGKVTSEYEKFNESFFSTIPVAEPVKKKDGGNQSEISSSIQEDVPAPNAGTLSIPEPTPGSLLVDSPRDAPMTPANIQFAEPYRLPADLTGDEDVQAYSESVRRNTENQYQHRQKYDEGTALRATQRKITNAEMYGTQAAAQANFAKTKMDLDLGPDWQQQYQAAADFFNQYNPDDPAQRDQAAMHRQAVDRISAHPQFQSYLSGLKAQQAAYNSYKSALDDPEYKSIVATRKARQSEKDAGQSVRDRYADAQIRTGAKAMADLMALPRTVSRSPVGRALTGTWILGSPDPNEYTVADELGSMADAVMEWTDIHVPKASQYEQQLFERSAPFKGYQVVVNENLEPVRVKNDKGQVVDVDQAFIDEFKASAAPATAEVRFTGYDNTFDKVGGLATDMMLMVAAGGGSRAGVFLTSFTQTQADAYREAIRDLNMSPNDAAEYAFMTATLQAGLESAVGNLETKMNPNSMAPVKKIGTAELKALTGKVRPVDLAVIRAKPFMDAVVGENAEEFGQNFVDAAIKDDFNSRTGAVMEGGMTPEQAKETLLLTTLVAAPFGGVQSATAVSDLHRRAILSLASNPKAFESMIDGMGLEENLAQQYKSMANAIAAANARLPQMTDDMRADILAKEWARQSLTPMEQSEGMLPAQAKIIADKQKELQAEITDAVLSAMEDPSALPKSTKERPEGTRVGSLVVPLMQKEVVPPVEIKPRLAEEFVDGNDQSPEALATAYSNGALAKTVDFENNADAVANLAISELEARGYEPSQDEHGAIKRYFISTLPQLAEFGTDEAFGIAADEYIDANSQKGTLRDRLSIESIDDTIADYFAGGGKISTVSFDRYGDDVWRKERSVSPLYFKTDGNNIDDLAQSWANDPKLGFGQSEEVIRQKIVDFIEKYPQKNVNEYLSERVATQDEGRKAARRKELAKYSSEPGLDEIDDDQVAAMDTEADRRIEQIEPEVVGRIEKFLMPYEKDGVVDVPAMREAIAKADLTPMDEGFDPDVSNAWDALGVDGQDVLRQIAGSSKPLDIQVAEVQDTVGVQDLGADAETVLSQYVNENGEIDLPALQKAWDEGGMLEWADTLSAKAYEKIEKIIENETEDFNNQPNASGEATVSDQGESPEQDQVGKSDQVAPRKKSDQQPQRAVISESRVVDDIVEESAWATTPEELERVEEKVDQALRKISLPTKIDAAVISEMADQGILTVDEMDALVEHLSIGTEIDPGLIDKATEGIEKLREVPEWLGAYQAARIAHARAMLQNKIAPSAPVVAISGNHVVVGNYAGDIPGAEKQGAVWVAPIANKDQVLALVYKNERPPSTDGAGSFGASVAKFLYKPGNWRKFRLITPEQMRDASRRADQMVDALSKRLGVRFEDNDIEFRMALKEMGRPELIDDPRVRGFKYKGVVYLRPGELEGAIHEYGHLWLEAIKVIDAVTFGQGQDAIKGSVYEKMVRDNPMYNDLDEDGILEEALALAIGTRGAAIYGSAWDQFQNWLQKMWASVAKFFGIDTQTMKANEFADWVVSEMVAGDPAAVRGELSRQIADLDLDGEGDAKFLFARNRIIDAAKEAAARAEIAQMVMDGKTLDKAAIAKLRGLGLPKSAIDRMYAEGLKAAGIRVTAPTGERAFPEAAELQRKIGNWFVDKFRVRGLATKSLHERNLKRKSEINSRTYEVGQALRRLESAVSAIVKKDKQRERWMYEQIQNVLEGSQPVDTVPAELWDAIADVRNLVDKLSRDLIMSGAVSADMAITILGNTGVEITAAAIDETNKVGRILSKRPEERSLEEHDLVEQYIQTYGGAVGTYLYRSYRANDDPDWRIKVPIHVRDAARRRIETMIRDRIDEETSALEDKMDDLDEKIADIRAKIAAGAQKMAAKVAAERDRLDDVLGQQSKYVAEKGKANKALNAQEAAIRRRLKALEDLMRRGDAMANLSNADFVVLINAPGFDANSLNGYLRSIYARLKEIDAIEQRKAKAEGASFARLDALTFRLQNVDNEIDTILERQAPSKIVGGSNLGAKDMQVLKGRRKEIPEEIRDLLGEYRDPRVSVMRSALRISTTLANQKFLGDVMQLGLAEGWLSTKEKKSGRLIVELASEGSNSMNPLNGLWTTPEIAQVFSEQMDRKNYDTWMKWWFMAVGMTKVGKTILAPAAQARNLYSNIMQAFRNGWIGQPGAWKGFVDGLKSYKTTQSKEFADYVTRLQLLGVVGTSVTAGDLRAQAEMIANDMGGDEYGQFNDLLSPAGNIAKKGYRIAANIYRATDEILKIWGFQVEAERYARALHGAKYSEMAPGPERDAVEAKAAEVIRAITPDYDLIPKIGQTLRRLPVTGSFISFPLEIYRNYSNWWSLVRSDMKSPKTRAVGLTRLGFAAAYMGALYGLAAWSAAAIGLTDDEEQAINPLLKPWQQNTLKVWLGKDDASGEYQFFNFGYVDPFAFWKKPLHRILSDNDDTFAEDLFNGATDVFDPILQPDLLAATTAQVLMNYNLQSKKPITVEAYGYWHPENLKRTRDFIRNRVQPGLVKTAWDAWDSANGGKMDEYGNVVSPDIVALNSVGMNVERVRPSVAFEKSLIGDRMKKEQILDAMQSTAYKEGRDVSRMQGGEFTAEQIQKRKDAANDRISEMYDITVKAYNEHLQAVGRKVQMANQVLGIPMPMIIKELEEKRFSKDEISVILGRNPMIYPKIKKPNF